MGRSSIWVRRIPASNIMPMMERFSMSLTPEGTDSTARGRASRCLPVTLPIMSVSRALTRS